MKTTKIFLMAALALTFAACSNDDNDIQSPAEQTAKAEGIPFTATISVANSATTRALAITEYYKIEATWADNEEVALIYDAGGTPTKTVAKVTKQTDGTATISATLASGATNGSDVTIIYPATAADGTTGNVKSDLLLAQNGELTGTGSIAENYDVRKGNGKLSINGGKATVNNGTAGTNVSLTNQYAICKFTLFESGDYLNVSSLTITIGGQDYVITPSSARSTLYAALPPFWGEAVSFSATGAEDTKPHVYFKNLAVIEAGNYYDSNLIMANFTWTSSDFEENYGNSSFNKNGITMTVEGEEWGDFSWLDMNFKKGKFESTAGNFTKIVVEAGNFGNMGDGWTVDTGGATWEGTPASSVDFGDGTDFAIEYATKIVFTLK